jgi:flagellar biosynthesis protein FlhB
MADRSQQTEKATPRRIQKARERGDFVSSRHLLGALHFTVATAVVALYFDDWFLGTSQLLRQLLQWSVSRELDGAQLIYLTREVLVRSLGPLAAAGAVVVALVVATQLVVTRFGVSGAKLTPDIKKLNPVQKLRSMVGENFMSFVQAAILAPLFLYFVYEMSVENLGLYFSLPRTNVATGALWMGSVIQSLLWKATAVFLVFGIVDLARNKYKYQRSLRMTKQEVRDEMKETEGSSETKARIRRLIRSFGRRRMLRDVKTATAVVVNPTHFAVALRYEPQTPGAPKVVAKGKNYLARRIRAIAEEHGISVVENPPLARSLYAAVEVGQEIPAHLYRAVAEVLAHVYKLLNSYGAARGRR